MLYCISYIPSYGLMESRAHMVAMSSDRPQSKASANPLRHGCNVCTLPVIGTVASSWPHPTARRGIITTHLFRIQLMTTTRISASLALVRSGSRGNNNENDLETGAE